MSNAQTIKTFIHEITHSELHSGAFTLASRQQKEVEAESTAFIVCDYLGLDTSDYSFGYIAAWAGENSKEVLKSCITNIKTASTKLIQELDSRLHISQQEKTPAEKKEMEQKVVEEANQVLQEKGLDAVVKDAVVYSPLPSEEKVSVSMDLREIREHAEMTAEITALEHPEKPFTFCTLSETGCSYESAVQEMDNTHMVYGTSNGILVYALTQSFTAGEVTPEMAHEIGLKTIDEYWEKQEVLLSTVQSEGVIQNRYVINPTSYMDGSKKQISGWDVHDMRRLAEKLGKELSAGRPEELHMYVTNQDRSFEADFVLQGNKQQVMDILTRQESYQYLNEYLISQGIPCQVEAVKPDTNFALSYDYSTMTVYDMHPEESSQQPAAEQTETEQVAPDQAAPEHAAAMVEIAGTAREEDVFQALNDAAPVIDGMTIRMNTVKQEGNAAESYIERLDVYEKLGYDARWPMVTIAYTNIPGVKNQSLNIHEAVKLLQKLSRKGELNANSFMKIKLSYTYNDWNYEVVQDIERRTGRINFIDYLNLPSKGIHHLKGHDSILTMVELAKNFAPDTQYGSDYADDMQLWAEYCRMELNHNSDAPVLPRPPEIDADYIVSNDDWRLER
jgi:hypothetical protein